MLVQIAHHALALLHVGLDATVVDFAVGHRTDVGDSLFGRIPSAQCLDAMIAGDPDPAAGDGGGSAVAVALLHHQHPGTQVMGAQRGGHGASSRTHHQYVAAVVPLRAVRAHRVAPLLFCLRNPAGFSAALPGAGIVRWD
ncbi:hypothetical protein D9M68_697650 [compost metagenome]